MEGEYKHYNISFNDFLGEFIKEEVDKKKLREYIDDNEDNMSKNLRTLLLLKSY
jgi:hypothetical protein